MQGAAAIRSRGLASKGSKQKIILCRPSEQALSCILSPSSVREISPGTMPAKTAAALATMAIVACSFSPTVRSHGALYIPTPRNAADRVLPEFTGGKAPLEACTCNNGFGGIDGPTKGCDLGLRGGVDGKGDGQSCLWWSQVRSFPLLPACLLLPEFEPNAMNLNRHYLYVYEPTY